MKPQNLKRKNDFINSEVGIEAVSFLEMMILDDSYNTEPSYSADTESYPDNLMPFMDKHVNYLYSHPMIDPQLYLSNLRLMSRITGVSTRQQRSMSMPRHT